MAFPKPVVSIIIPTYQRPNDLSRCLRSIAETVKLPHEVIVVAVAGDEPTQAVLKTFEATLIVQPTRGGCVQAMNLGFRAATGEYLMQVNDDCELLPHSVANAVRFLAAPAHHQVGQAAFFHNSPVTRNIHQQIQLDGEWFYTGQVRGLCYANFGLARRVLYFMYGADPDFSLKVWHEAKLSVTPCPGALLRHHELNDERGQRERAAQHDDNRKLFAKWGLDV